MLRAISNILHHKLLVKRLVFVVTWTLLLKSTKGQASDSCIVVSLGTIAFIKNNVTVTNTIRKKLDSAILTINKKLNCVVKVIGTANISCDRNTNDGQHSWDRVNSIVSYLISKGITEDRVICQFSDIDKNLIELRLEPDYILQLPLKPHPNFRQHKS